MTKRSRRYILLFWLGTLLLLCLVTYLCFHDVISGQKTFIWGGDNTQQSYAWMGKIWNSLHHDGEIALWDFNQYGGTSFAGEIQTAPFYIGNVLFAAITPTYSQHALDLYILFHYWIASVFMFAFLRYNKQNYFACLTGAVLFAYIGSVSARSTGQSNIFMSLVYLPAVIWMFQIAIDRSREKRGAFLYYIASGAFLGTMILAGHMQPFFHTIIALGLFAICYSNSIHEFGKNVVALVFVGIVSLIICFGQVVSGLEYMNRSYRWVGLENPVTGFTSLPGEAYDFVVTRLSNLKDVVINNEIGDGCTLYISVAGAILFCAGIGSFCFSWKNKESGRRIGLYAIVTTLICLILSFGRQNFLGRLLTIIPGFASVREPARILFVYNFSVAIMIAFGITFIGKKLKKIKIKISYKGLISAIWGCMAFISIVYFAVDYNSGKQTSSTNTTSAITQYEKNELVNYLINEANEDLNTGYLYRYTCDTLEDTLTPNLGSVYNELLGTHGHRATMPVAYFDYLGVNGWNWNEHLSDAFAVKYLVTQKGIDAERFSNYTYLTTKCDRDIYIKNNPQNYITLWDNKTESINLQAESIKKKTNSISIIANVPNDGKIRIAQMYYPGWAASVDGKNIKIDTDDEGFMTFDINPGMHDIIIYYKPWWYTTWIIMVIVAVMICGGYVVIRKYQKKRISTYQ